MSRLIDAEYILPLIPNEEIVSKSIIANAPTVIAENAITELTGDLISREALKKEFARYGEKAKFTQGACQRIIENALTVEQPTGEWEFVKPWHLDCNASIYRCSVCGRTTLVGKEQTVYELYPYCHCGAKMKGGEEE